MVGSRKYLVAVSGIIFVVLVTASCARQDEISEALPVQHTSPLRQDSEAAELVETGQGTADLRALAEQGDAKAQSYLGWTYYYDVEIGKGIPEDIKKGIYWATKAAEQGDSGSQTFVSRFYLKGEKNIQDTFKPSVILRPSVVFGPEDKFFNTFASLTQFLPALPLIGEGKTKFAPIYVGDVAKAIVKALELNNSEPKIYELGGPENYSFKELMEILLTEIRKRRFFISIPFNIAKFQSYFLQIIPNPLLTPDQVEMLKYNNIVSGDCPTLKDLGITGTSIQSILPKYIYRFRTGGQFG